MYLIIDVLIYRDRNPRELILMNNSIETWSWIRSLSDMEVRGCGHSMALYSCSIVFRQQRWPFSHGSTRHYPNKAHHYSPTSAENLCLGTKAIQTILGHLGRCNHVSTALILGILRKGQPLRCEILLRPFPCHFHKDFLLATHYPHFKIVIGHPHTDILVGKELMQIK